MPPHVCVLLSASVSQISLKHKHWLRIWIYWVVDSYSLELLSCKIGAVVAVSPGIVYIGIGVCMHSSKPHRTFILTLNNSELLGSLYLFSWTSRTVSNNV